METLNQLIAKRDSLKIQVSADVKILMDLEKQISDEKNKEAVGKCYSDTDQGFTAYLRVISVVEDFCCGHKVMFDKTLKRNVVQTYSKIFLTETLKPISRKKFDAELAKALKGIDE